MAGEPGEQLAADRLGGARGARVIASGEQHNYVIAGKLARRRQRAERVSDDATGRTIAERKHSCPAAFASGYVSVGTNDD